MHCKWNSEAQIHSLCCHFILNFLITLTKMCSRYFFFKISFLRIDNWNTPDFTRSKSQFLRVNFQPKDPHVVEVPRDNLGAGVHFFTQVLPLVIYIGAVLGLLYYLGITQFILTKFGWLMSKTFQTTGVESVSLVANLFFSVVCNHWFNTCVKWQWNYQYQIQKVSYHFI